jgi:sugar lactone lactonase YvrE
VFPQRPVLSLGVVGKAGNADGEFNQPNDVVVGPDGSIYVADGGTRRQHLRGRRTRCAGHDHRIEAPAYQLPMADGVANDGALELVVR